MDEYIPPSKWTTQARYKRRKKDLGLCLDCSEKAVPGKLKCQKHSDGDNAKAKKYQAKMRAINLCTICGKEEPYKPGVGRCEHCHQLAAYSQRLRMSNLYI